MWPSLRLFEPPLSLKGRENSVALINTVDLNLSKIKAIRVQRIPSPRIGRRGANGTQWNEPG
jgi:hypothetical protein